MYWLKAEIEVWSNFIMLFTSFFFWSGFSIYFLKWEFLSFLFYSAEDGCVWNNVVATPQNIMHVLQLKGVYTANL